MAKYRVQIADRALKEAQRLPIDVRVRLVQGIEDLADEPRPPGSRKLSGHPGFRIRKGPYRVLYTVDDDARVIRVYRMGHRRDVYRTL
jgi:mRNA interferase RelE/StbE